MEQILLQVAKERSPITGEAFEPLSPKYKKEKVADGERGVPDLQRSGDMLDSLDYRLTSDGIEIGVYGDAAARADGHNNLSGGSLLPLRQFLPNVGDSFMPSIEKEIEKIVADSIADSGEIPVDALGGIESSSDLYDVLGSFLQLESRSAIRSVVLGNANLYNTLSELDLLDYL